MHLPLLAVGKLAGVVDPSQIRPIDGREETSGLQTALHRCRWEGLLGLSADGGDASEGGPGHEETISFMQADGCGANL